MENLGAKNNVPDALFGATFESLLHSQWGYRGWKNRPPFHKHRIRINPKSGGSTTPAYGSSILFDIPKRGALLRRVTARWKTAALATGNESRFVDYAGFAMLKNSILRYGTNDIQTIKPMELYITNRLDHRRKDQEAVAHLAGGDLPATGLGIDSRENRATGVQQWTVSLPFHFSETADKCIFTEALGNHLEIELQLEEFLNVVDVTLASATPTGGAISDFHLVAEFVHIEDYERDFHLMRTISPKGIIKAVRAHSYQPRASITSGQRQFTYPLTNLKQACYEFRFVIRDDRDVDGQLTGRKDYFNFLTLARGGVGDEYWQLRSGDTDITEAMNEQWNIYVENRDHHSGDSGDLIYGEAFTYHPEDRRNCTGNITWAGYHNPELLLDAGANFPANLIVDGISREYNATHEIAGEYLRIFK